MSQPEPGMRRRRKKNTVIINENTVITLWLHKELFYFNLTDYNPSSGIYSYIINKTWFSLSTTVFFFTMHYDCSPARATRWHHTPSTVILLTASIAVHYYQSLNKLFEQTLADHEVNMFFNTSTLLQSHDKFNLQSSSFGRETHGTPGSHWTDSERHMQRPYPEFYLRCSMRFCK